MTNENREVIGRPVSDLATPALILDKEILDSNIRRLSLAAESSSVRLRPHAKAHKCTQIASLQIEHGAVGICCQTVSEVEAFANDGVTDILLTNQIPDRAKAERLSVINADVVLGVCVDDPIQIELLANAVAESGRKIDIYVEIDVGGRRCGVDSLDDALYLARLSAQAEGLRYSGLQVYNGKNQHIRDAHERKTAVHNTAEAILSMAKGLEREGFEPKTLSGGGTGSAEFDLQFGVLNELQCGTYALMDADYLSIESTSSTNYLQFDSALAVLTKVISVRKGEHAVVDAGLKALAFDSGMPNVFSPSGLTYSNPSDEHGIFVETGAGAKMPNVGDLVTLIPGHCDPTVAQHEKLHVISNGEVIDIWSTVSRGIW